jgi:hypothetical protein
MNEPDLFFDKIHYLNEIKEKNKKYQNFIFAKYSQNAINILIQTYRDYLGYKNF